MASRGRGAERCVLGGRVGPQTLPGNEASHEDDMELSARNQLRGKVKSVKAGTIMAEVVIDLGGGQELVAEITRGSVRRLGLKRGDTVTAIVKSTSIMVGK